ncbi:MAG: phosphopantothenoylcysteine decarboxylase, partial [Traorella sp.]
LVNAGPTLERIDPVRFISNHSSGKMGIAIAKAALHMGAQVSLVCGPIQQRIPSHINVISIESAQEMFEQMTSHYEQADYVICAAAIADYTPAEKKDHKIKKSDSEMVLKLNKTKDILKYLGEHKTHQKLCGFAMETENEIENGREKLISKNCDMLVVNSLNKQGAGFKYDTNIATILTSNEQIEYGLMSKDELAINILTKLMEV